MTSGGIKDFEGENVIPGFSRALKMKVKFLEFYVMQQVYEAEWKDAQDNRELSTKAQSDEHAMRMRERARNCKSVDPSKR